MIDAVKQRLISNWRQVHRFWSVRLITLGSVLQAVFTVWGTLPNDLWNMMPGEVKAHLPVGLIAALPLIFFIVAVPARIMQQKKLAHD